MYKVFTYRKYDKKKIDERNKETCSVNGTTIIEEDAQYLNEGKKQDNFQT
jgi:hypothetical protein